MPSPTRKLDLSNPREGAMNPSERGPRDGVPEARKRTSPAQTTSNIEGPATPLSHAELAHELSGANERIEHRLAEAATWPALPVHPPRWASKIIEREGEFYAVHGMTGALYDLRPGDLSAEDWGKLRAHASARGASRGEVALLVAKPIPPRPIPGPSQPCVVCGESSEPSAVGTPTCSAECTGTLADRILPRAADTLAAGSDPASLKPKARRRRPPPVRDGPASVERAAERLGDCRSVLERHGHRVPGRMARCPLHDDRIPSLSLFSGTDGKSLWRCHACDRGGDAIDLEVALSGQAVADVIGWWGR